MKVKELRASLGITQEKFAAAVGCSLSTLQRWENKERELKIDSEYIMSPYRDKMAELAKNEKKPDYGQKHRDHIESKLEEEIFCIGGCDAEFTKNLINEIKCGNISLLSINY